MPARQELTDFRKRLDMALETAGDAATLKAVAEAALNPIKRVRHTFFCKGCGKQQTQQVEVVDHVGAAMALERLLNQAKGRPQEEQSDAGVTVIYKVILGEDPEEDFAEDGS